MVYKYEWHEGVRLKVDADVVGKEFEKIEKKDGTITKESVVETAKSEKNPMHELFEWDDEIAGEKYRIHQAGYLIRMLVKVAANEPGEEVKKPIRAFVSVKPTSYTKKGEFIDTFKALSQEDTRKVVLQNALKELIAFKTKYETFSELSEVMSAIDKVMEMNGR